MPPNMMKALVGSSPNVMGRRSATVSAGPIPGSTPTAVPSVTPANAQARCGQVSALANREWTLASPWKRWELSGTIEQAEASR